MKILIFGGTTEGRLLAQALSQRGLPATVSVATPLGAQELSGLPGITPLVGRKTAQEMAELLKSFDRCVDATHPYAVEASRNIRTACQAAEVPLRRLLRAESSHETGHWVESPEEAARWLRERSGNVLLAIGAKGIGAFQDLDRERLYPRVLPVVESILACQQAGIPTRNIIALHGPFSRDLNRAMLEQYHIRYLVTKDGDYVLNQNAAMNSDPGAAGYIRIDPNQKFTIDEQGNIWQNRAVVGRVGVVDFANYNYLEKFGENLYQTVDGAQIVAAGAQVEQGVIEASNVQVVSEMVDMITITRAYEANQKIIQTIDTMLDKAVNQVGKL